MKVELANSYTLQKMIGGLEKQMRIDNEIKIIDRLYESGAIDKETYVDNLKILRKKSYM